MIAEARPWVDVEAAAREWTRDFMPSVNRRVFFGPSNEAALPQIVLFRIAGTDDECLIQFEVWDNFKRPAIAVAMDLATQIDLLSRYVYRPTNGPAVLLHGARVLDMRWLPDTEGATPRYVVEAVITATPA